LMEARDHEWVGQEQGGEGELLEGCERGNWCREYEGIG
jgi:hypothetical protein